LRLRVGFEIVLDLALRHGFDPFHFLAKSTVETEPIILRIVVHVIALNQSDCSVLSPVDLAQKSL